MSKALVSINVTTFNRADFLDKCLRSILNQDYHDFEIVVVDDCSTDNTEVIVREFQKIDARIKYFKHKSNQGNACARNTALRNCSGNYVAFLDDDDEWLHKNKLSTQVDIFSKNPGIGIVCSNVRIYTEKDKFYDKKISIPTDIKSHVLVGNSLIYNSTVMTTKKLMDEVGGFDEMLPKGVDSDFFRRAILIYNADVFFMSEITSKVKEYGEDRMTPLKNKGALLDDCQSHLMCLEKFSNVFRDNSSARFLRKKRLYKNYFKLIKLTRNPVYIISIIRCMFK